MNHNTVIETNRLIMREFSAEIDAEFAFELNSDPEVLQYTGDDPFADIEAARLFLTAYADHYKRYGMGRWVVIDKVSNEPLGWCGLKRHDDFIDLGYRFLKSHWGKGYATEASQACIEYGFNTLGLNEIVGRTDRMNIASVHVLEKCQMTFWKTDECNGLEDVLYYRISKS